MVKKPKLDNHRYQCQSSFTCIDCSTTFDGPAEYKGHTQCISEAEKYQKGLYKGAKGVRFPVIALDLFAYRVLHESRSKVRTGSRMETTGSTIGSKVPTETKLLRVSTNLGAAIMALGVVQVVVQDNPGAGATNVTRAPVLTTLPLGRRYACLQ